MHIVNEGPPGAARATLNVNGVSGGQPVDGIQTPCVADRCRAVFDRRFLIQEGFESVKAEIEALLAKTAARISGARYELEDLMVVHPTQAPEGDRRPDERDPRARAHAHGPGPARVAVGQGFLR